MKSFKLVALPGLTAILLVAVAAPLHSQTIPSSYERIEKSQEAGPWVGVFSGGTGRFGFGPKSGTVFGGRYAVEIGGPFSFEGVSGILAGTRDVIDPELSEGNRVSGEADVQMLMVEARFKFALTGRRTWHGLSPHLLFGGGIGYEFAGAQPADERILEGDRFEFGTRFLGTAGTGVRWFLNDTWTVRADGTVRFWQLQTPLGYSEANRGFENVEEKQWINNYALTIGLGFRF